jgi:hypothetical protein
VNGTEALYGKKVPFSDILKGKAQSNNPDAQSFVNAVQNAKQTAQVR